MGRGGGRENHRETLVVKKGMDSRGKEMNQEGEKRGKKGKQSRWLEKDGGKILSWERDKKMRRKLGGEKR